MQIYDLLFTRYVVAHVTFVVDVVGVDVVVTRLNVVDCCVDYICCHLPFDCEHDYIWDV